MILCKSRPISLSISLDHFLSGLFPRFLYYWDSPVSGKMISFISPVWMVNLYVELFVSTQYSPVWFTDVLVGVGVFICLVKSILVTWLAIILRYFMRLYLVLYLCTSGTLMVIPSYIIWVSFYQNFLCVIQDYVRCYLMRFP